MKALRLLLPFAALLAVFVGTTVFASQEMAKKEKKPLFVLFGEVPG